MIILEPNTKQGKLKHVEGRVLLRVDTQFKNNHTFADGTTIRLERVYDNFDNKYTQPIQGNVISAENIPEGAIVLFHHNGTHAVNQILNADQLSGEDIASQVKLYSVPERECYAWKMSDGEWQPTKGFAFALRCFRPYSGTIQGIEPTLLKCTLWMRTGEYKNLAVRTVKAADYEIIFREPDTGREARIIRCRPDGDAIERREEEVIAIDHKLTDEILNNKVYVGLSKSDAKPLNEYVCQ